MNFTGSISTLPPRADSLKAPVAEGAPRDGYRVLMIVESSLGGTGRHVLDLADGLIRRGCEVHVIHSNVRIDQMFKDRLREIPAVVATALPMRTSIHPADFKIARTIRRYVRENGPFDFIHGHSSKGGALARFAAFGTSAAAYYTLHGLIMMDPGLRRWKKLMYLGIEHSLALRTQRIIAVSPEEQRAAIGLGLGKSRVELIPNGIAPLKLTPRSDARRELGVQDDEIVIGYVGRLVDQKAPHVLLGAFKIAAAKQPGLRLAMVGGGPLAEPMKELAVSLGIADQALWLGERDARSVLAAFDVFALSSRKEGLPYVILEASAVGLPVVATQAAGVEILVKPGYNGEVVPTDDTNAFGDALLAICSDEAKRARYAANALEHAKLFTADTMVEATLASYRSVHNPKAATASA